MKQSCVVNDTLAVQQIVSELQFAPLMSEIFLSVFGMGPPQSTRQYFYLFLSRVINVSQRPKGRPVSTGQKRFGAPPYRGVGDVWGKYGLIIYF